MTPRGVGARELGQPRHAQAAVDRTDHLDGDVERLGDRLARDIERRPRPREAHLRREARERVAQRGRRQARDDALAPLADRRPRSPRPAARRATATTSRSGRRRLAARTTSCAARPPRSPSATRVTNACATWISSESARSATRSPAGTAKASAADHRRGDARPGPDHEDVRACCDACLEQRGHRARHRAGPDVVLQRHLGADLLADRERPSAREREARSPSSGRLCRGAVRR